MSSVTKRISEITQPYGGYIKPSQFELQKLDDGRTLFETENIHASVVGMAVDYLTRFVMGASKEEAFSISLKGVQAKTLICKTPDDLILSDELLSCIKGLDEYSVSNACQMVTFDVWYRNPMAAFNAKQAEDTYPDSDTIHNIQVMVQRCVDFWEKNGPIIKSGFTFEPNGYTETVTAGDGDFLTNDTLWDIKVLKSKPKSQHTLQLLMYWIMGKHSGNDEFKNITKLGIFNPRLNTVYRLNMSKVDIETIRTVETEVICYK